jgi:FtsP/CotA-like multicopper oxidase with cupredoxin domain
LGTEIRFTISNPLDATLVVHGLSIRRVATLDSLVVPAGTTRQVRFKADAEGTYFYRGRLDGSPTAVRDFESAVLSGAFIVDPPGAAAPPDDRVLMMQIWYDGMLENGEPDFSREFLVINGRPWPLTERLTYDMGDSIRWRLINATEKGHPMHLHGFYYRVDARGDFARDTIYWPAQRRLAVTERMASNTTLSMVWSPDRPGGWIFHCHISFHVVYNPSLRPDYETEAERDRHLLLGDHEGDPHSHVLEGMGGLMMGMYVRPPAGWEPREPQRRRLRLFVQSDSIPADSASEEPQLAAPDRRRFAYVLQTGEQEPAPDSVRLPGSPIVLWKGEPTAITVINRTDEPTQVHWHGLEIESYFDGVTGVGGYPDRLTPAILPGDSFEIRITPPRAGSFMYHTHVSDIRQQSAGLYGAFVVLEEGEEWDPATDRIFMLGLSPSEEGVHLNGSRAPEPLRFEVGTIYRLRLMNITLFNGGAKLWLTRDGAPVRWRLISKDGWDVYPHQRERIAAEQTVSVGETFDFEYRPGREGELHLEVRSGGGRLFVDQLIRVVDREIDGDDDGDGDGD